MRCTSLIPLAFVCLAGCKSSGTTGQQSNEESDLDYLQGWWVADSFEYEGKPVGDAILRRTRMKVEGDTMELVETSKVGELVTFKLDESQDPKHIDMRIAKKGPDYGKLVLGIYRLNGDHLRICWAAPGKPRPTAFTTINDMAVASLSLRRFGEPD